MARSFVFVLLLAAAPALGASPPYPIVDTGQDTCYGDRRAIACPNPGQAFFGQDAQYKGNQARYRDNGDGTVSDLVTGLMWEKGFRRDVNFHDAPAEAAKARTGGHADWRVPTVKELYSLIDFRGSTGTAPPERNAPPADAWPYLDTRFFDFEYPAVNRYIDAQYVTGTAYRGIVMGNQQAFFGVNFADGRIKGYPQAGRRDGSGWYARHVRGNPVYGKNDFHDKGDGTVLDRATGLLWAKGDGGKGRDWAGALRFCEDLKLGGRDDWRLPNAKELQGIVDYTRAPNATNSAAIDPVFDITQVKVEEGHDNWPYFWSSTTHLDGPRQGDFAVYVAFGWALGYMRMPPWSQEMTLLDVHGAGAQRSSPKSGDEASLPKGHGPQGDVLRIQNFARCVTGP